MRGEEVDGVVDGLRSLVDVARGSEGGVRGNVFEEVEERFAHPSVRVHHEHHDLFLFVYISIRNIENLP